MYLKEGTSLADKSASVGDSRFFHFSSQLVRLVKFFSFFLMVFLHLHGFSARPVQGRCPSAYTPQHCIYFWVCTDFLHFSIFPFSHAVATVAQQMAVPLFKAYNDSIFIKKGHADHLKLVSDAQSSKKLGKDADGKNKLYNAVDVGICLPPGL
jgi:hypothetical protein